MAYRVRDSDGKFIEVNDKVKSDADAVVVEKKQAQNYRKSRNTDEDRFTSIRRMQHKSARATAKERSLISRRARLEINNEIIAARRAAAAEKLATQASRDLINRRAWMSALDEATKARRAGQDRRPLSVQLPPIVANGVLTVGVLGVADPTLIRSINVTYLTAPTSTLGAVTLEVKKVEGGVTTLLQDAAAFDLETLAVAVPGQVTSGVLDSTTRTLSKDAYLYLEVTSDNADAVDGVGGVLTIHLKTCK